MNRSDFDRLETLIDAFGLSEVLEAISVICGAKAEHIASMWQDTTTAKLWMQRSTILERTAYSHMMKG